MTEPETEADENETDEQFADETTSIDARDPDEDQVIGVDVARGDEGDSDD